MKSRFNRSSITALALTVFILSAPLSALPRDGGDRDRNQPPIVRIIKQIARFFGIHTLEELPTPPKP